MNQFRGLVMDAVVVDLGLPVLLAADDEDLSWQDNALCAQTDPEAFYPEKGGSTREAKAICAGCEVRAVCLKYALDHDERFGIWGGLSERERRKLKRDRHGTAERYAGGCRCDRCKSVEVASYAKGYSRRKADPGAAA